MPDHTPERETKEQRRERLAHVLEKLDADSQGTFLDLCELLLMFADRSQMMIKWNHPRVLVHLKHNGKRAIKDEL